MRHQTKKATTENKQQTTTTTCELLVIHSRFVKKFGLSPLLYWFPLSTLWKNLETTSLNAISLITKKGTRCLGKLAKAQLRCITVSILIGFISQEFPRNKQCKDLTRNTRVIWNTTRIIRLLGYPAFVCLFLKKKVLALTNFFLWYYFFCSPQYKWLVKDLRKALDDKKAGKIDWIVVFGHRYCYQFVLVATIQPPACPWILCCCCC